ncbi:MAG: M48 family metallopeptidase, partial [Bacteroidota bacterium]|nr:M48 family metallopeptidase [Bacteroidota bacterium]
MAGIIFYLIVAIVVFDFILERTLDYLNTTRWSETLPKEVEGIYDEEKYRQSMQYEKVNYHFGILTSVFSFLLLSGMLLAGGFAWLDNWTVAISRNEIIRALVFFGILMWASDILTIPFQWYSTFHIEEKFGFNRTTVKTFILDKLKGWGISALIGGGLMSLIIWFWKTAGSSFWIYAWIIISAFSLFMTFFYSSLIVPLFNKQTPLEEGELKTAIRQFASGVGFSLENIYVIDGSKRSTKANAYFAGFGAKKRIVLYDTLINDLSTEEIVGVLAHEIGHYKKKHVLTSMLLSIAQTGVMLFILSLFLGIPAMSLALGASAPSFHMGLIAFGILFTPLSFFVG